METAAQKIRVRDKRQITLPYEAENILGIKPNDFLDVEVTSTEIILRRTGTRKRPHLVNDVTKYAGIGKSLKASAEEIVNDIRNDRDSWKF